MADDGKLRSLQDSKRIADTVEFELGLSKERFRRDIAARASAVRNATSAQVADYAWTALKHYVPIFQWTSGMTFSSVQADVIAGLTVSSMAVPQGISYAGIAGVPLIMGLYSHFVPTIVYAALGRSRQEVVGTVAVMTLLVAEGLDGVLTEAECPAYFDSELNPLKLAQSTLCPKQYVQAVITLTFLTGIVQIIGSMVNLAWFVQFVGHPVFSGFLSGAAVIIAIAQLSGWFGYPIARASFIYDGLYLSFRNFQNVNGVTLGLGLLWLIILIGMKWGSTKRNYLKWMKPAGPLLACFLGIIIFAADPNLAKKYKVKLVGKLPQGLPPPSSHIIDFTNLTRFVPTAVAIGMISYLELIAIGRALAIKVGYDLPANHELGALGIANLVGSMFTCIPASGSLSRSAVNYATGAQTQFASFVSGIVIMCSLLFLTPVFQYLPSYVLSSIIINAVSSLIAWQESIHLWHVNKVDWFLQVFTFLAVIFLGVEIGLAAAVAMSVLILVVDAARPKVEVLWRLPGSDTYVSVHKRESAGVFIKNVLVLRIGGNMYFANTDYVLEKIRAHIREYSKLDPVKYVVIDMTAVGSIDTPSVQSFKELISDMRKSNVAVAFSGVNPQVEDVLRNSKLVDDIGEEWIHARVHDAVKHSLAHEVDELKKPSALALSVSSDAADGAKATKRGGARGGFFGLFSPVR